MQMVQAVRAAEKSLGEVNYQLTDKQQKGRAFSRSLYVVNDLKQGEEFSSENIRSIRPGFGLHPKYYNQILGQKATRDYFKGDRLQWD